ncbi:shikimate dehydrogenase [Pararhodobacter zhoushanensis]|uniref:Shikimate dehydrogenase (NADP(+)) n=1 Tax=Pararhodobacter zhoushanensis TaxID=2479545 RepID=A0ABT3GUM1_9RHOB|nr:shikimate dehydrogenase [Pararhodobacter zhoushanensis]MCW1931247.1 shikimate dehydrogenase [Pararhodobacter zhoushanensis]
MKPTLRLAGVIGDPIAHSRSPRLHGYWLQRYGITGHYVPLHIRGEDFAKSLEVLPKMGFTGVNVTLPHKHSALALSDHITPLARRIGAANTLTFTENGIEADNTDAYGFAQNILEAHPSWAPRRVALIGAGGASRAVIAALQDLGAAEILLTNRTQSRAEALAQEFGAGVIVVPWADRAAMLDGCDTLVNSTSMGMQGNPALDLDLSALPRDAIVNDLVYAPLETPLLAAARARGNASVDGLGMLLHQAAPGFERWFGVTPQVDADLRKAVLA